MSYLLCSLKMQLKSSANQGRFIGRCIESVKKQEGDFAIEHIILDNCSTDETKEILDAYQQNPGKVEVTCIIERDSGQTAAINKGFKLATGDVVCWLNTDEWYSDGVLAEIVNYFNTHRDTDVLFGNMTFVDEFGNTIKVKKEFGFYRGMLLYYGCYIPSCATFVRRRIIDDGYLLDESYRVCMDFEWYARLAHNHYTFSHIPLNVAYFIMHGNNISKIVPYELRRFDYNRVQLLYGSFPGFPKYFRIQIYNILYWYWIIIRVLLRNFK